MIARYGVRKTRAGRAQVLRRKVIINWGVSSYFGWGVYGLNLALAWAHDPDLSLVAGLPVNPQDLAVDPLRAQALSEFMRESARFRARLEPFRGKDANTQSPLLAALGNDFKMLPLENVRFTGTPTIGVTFFETARFGPDAIEIASNYPLILTGSSWNEQVLRAYGLSNVRTVLQGVDPSLFHPAPRVVYAGDRFLVFSGGKLELRKGQDITIAAFRRFAERHPDAVLVAAWHSPWPSVARSVDRSGLAAPVTFHDSGELDAPRWAAANGLRPEQFLDAGKTPNALMPQLLRQMDVALFPNRSEGGTNLVAMECMACGVPVILSANTGHLDLIEDDNSFVLERQGATLVEPTAGAFGDTPGWGESDVDEAVELLERAYGDREAARLRGMRGAETLSRLTWTRTAAEVKAALFDVCGW
jgi:glycosyltransferase involved in cell wall biosynthesis